jgi:hypothetical protein
MGSSLSFEQDEVLQPGSSQAQFNDLCCANRNCMQQKKEEGKSKKRQIRGFSYEQVRAPSKDHSSEQQKNDIEMSLTNQPRRSSGDKIEINDRRSSKGSVIPAWLRDPEPLPDWTPQQQRVLISQLDENPLSRNHSEHLKRTFEKTHRLIPEKSIEEIDICYKHLQLKRIAYFGAQNRQSSPTNRTYSNQP